MSDQEIQTDSERRLDAVRELLEHHRQAEHLIHKRSLTALAQRLDRLHAADIADILEALPLEERLLIWDLVRSERDGEILLEVSDSVRESLIQVMDTAELVAAAGQLDADELADLAPDLPDEVLQDVFNTLDHEERQQLRVAMSYPEESVGALMDFDLVSVRDDISLEVVLRYLRRFQNFPDHTDKFFVTDRQGLLKGVLPLKQLLLSEPDLEVSQVMFHGVFSLRPEEQAQEAAEAFERYDLISAAVVDSEGRLIGRVTVDAVVDYIRERNESERLMQAGLREDEDLFAPIWSSLRNRGPWLGINLITALVASRIIGLFEDAIEQLVALATLMPIVAGMGGNVGNQTITMIVRVLALRQIRGREVSNLYFKEIKLSLINGVIWGGMLAAITWFLYHQIPLSGVIMLAMTLNFLLASILGVSIPLIRNRMGHDPALGSSVLITAITDSGGFFIFLGLASLLLLP
jgi:magnesium transporter